MATRVYLDTWLLRALVSDQGHERGDAKHELSKLVSNSFEVVVPQIALGEAFATIMRDYSDNLAEAHNKLIKLHDDLKLVIDSRTCLPSPTILSLQYAQEMKNEDSNLRETDLLIVSQALVDPESQRLLTADRDLLDSMVITNKEQELRDSGNRNQVLKIVDGL